MNEKFHVNNDDHPPDPFEEVLNLEGTYFQNGFERGKADGIEAGMVEGRSVGIKTAFEKFQAISMMHARVEVWAAAFLQSQSREQNSSQSSQHKDICSDQKDSVHDETNHNEDRLRVKLQNLYDLTNPASLPLTNADDQISDFDNRYRQAQGKYKVLERMLEPRDKRLERSAETFSTSQTAMGSSENIEDVMK